MRGSDSALDPSVLEAMLHLALYMCFLWGFCATLEASKGMNITKYGKEMTIKVENWVLKFLEIFFLGSHLPSIIYRKYSGNFRNTFLHITKQFSGDFSFKSQVTLLCS